MTILIILGEEYKLQSSSLCSFLQSPVASSLFCPNILLSTLCKICCVWQMMITLIRYGTFSQMTCNAMIETCSCLKSSVPWDITPCNPLKVSRRLGGTYRLHLQGRRISQAGNQQKAVRALLVLVFYPEDGGDMLLRDVGWLSTDYTALYPRTQNSSQPPLWEHCICFCCLLPTP
jgi:hypothetical protein